MDLEIDVSFLIANLLAFVIVIQSRSGTQSQIDFPIKLINNCPLQHAAHFQGGDMRFVLELAHKWNEFPNNSFR